MSADLEALIEGNVNAPENLMIDGSSSKLTVNIGPNSLKAANSFVVTGLTPRAESQRKSTRLP